MIREILFSVVIPTYNRAPFILRTLNTVLNQEYKNFEVIIVDDGSSDNTLELLETVNDSRLRIISIPNSERGAARNRGAEASQGDYINFFDSDDLLLDNHLTTANETIAAYENPEVFHLNFQVKTPEDLTIKTGRLYSKRETANKRLIRENPFSCNGVFIRKDIAVLNKFNEDRRLSISEDYELWLRLGSRYPLHMINKVTSLIIAHENRSVHSVDETKLLARKNLLIKYAFQDAQVQRMYGSKKNRIAAFCDTYIALHLIVDGHPKLGLHYFIKGIMLYPLCVFDRRTLGITKQLIVQSYKKIKNTKIFIFI